MPQSQGGRNDYAWADKGSAIAGMPHHLADKFAAAAAVRCSGRARILPRAAEEGTAEGGGGAAAAAISLVLQVAHAHHAAHGPPPQRSMRGRGRRRRDLGVTKGACRFAPSSPRKCCLLASCRYGTNKGDNAMLTHHMIRRFLTVAAVFALCVGLVAQGSIASHAAVFPSHSGR